jgi:hypothetical protein
MPGLLSPITLAATKPLKRSTCSGPTTLDRADGRQRNHRVAGRAAHIDLAQVVRLHAVAGFGLQLHAIDAAGLVEVIDVERAHRALQRLVDAGQRDAERQRLRFVDLDEQLRHGRAEEGADPGEFGCFCSSAMKAWTTSLSFLAVAVDAVLHIDLEAAGGAQAHDRRRVEDQRHAVRLHHADAHELAGQILRLGLRSLQSLSGMKMVPALGLLPPPIRSKPETTKVCLTAGSAATIWRMLRRWLRCA